jgi:hypothetical protein
MPDGVPHGTKDCHVGNFVDGDKDGARLSWFAMVAFSLQSMAQPLSRWKPTSKYASMTLEQLPQGHLSMATQTMVFNSLHDVLVSGIAAKRHISHSKDDILLKLVLKHSSKCAWAFISRISPKVGNCDVNLLGEVLGTCDGLSEGDWLLLIDGFNGGAKWLGGSLLEGQRIWDSDGIKLGCNWAPQATEHPALASKPQLIYFSTSLWHKSQGQLETASQASDSMSAQVDPGWGSSSTTQLSQTFEPESM